MKNQCLAGTNKDPIIRGAKLATMFLKRGYTIKEVAKKLDTSVTNARRLIDVVSMVVPIVELEQRYTLERGRPPVVYGLMRDN